MDSVSVETSPENEWIKQRIVDGKVSFCYVGIVKFIEQQKFDKNLNYKNY
jgi:hypothetical protein